VDGGGWAPKETHLLQEIFQIVQLGIVKTPRVIPAAFGSLKFSLIQGTSIRRLIEVVVEINRLAAEIVIIKLQITKII